LIEGDVILRATPQWQPMMLAPATLKRDTGVSFQQWLETVSGSTKGKPPESVHMFTNLVFQP
jgi:hypothetical protein